MPDTFSAFQGDEGLWGVHDQHGAVLYDPTFARATAEAVADMENSEKPPVDWEETAERLKQAGLPF